MNTLAKRRVLRAELRAQAAEVEQVVRDVGRWIAHTDAVLDRVFELELDPCWSTLVDARRVAAGRQLELVETARELRAEAAST